MDFLYNVGYLSNGSRPAATKSFDAEQVRASSKVGSSSDFGLMEHLLHDNELEKIRQQQIVLRYSEAKLKGKGTSSRG
jgi:hypothetical protein